MTLPKSAVDRERQKFVEDASGDVCVRTKASGDAPTLPTGAATAANQTTIIGHVDGLETSLTTLAGTVSGSEQQVDIVSVTPDLMLGTDFSNVFGTSSLTSDNAVGVASAGYSLQSHFEATTGWSTSAGADNLETDTDHRGPGTNSLEFDKIDGNATAMISKTISSFDMSAYSTHAIGHMHVYLSDLTDVDYVFVRMGTDSSNYWQWNFDGGLFTAGWNDMNAVINQPTSQTGDGMDLSAATWMAFGVVFDNASDTLADIRTSGWQIKRVLEIAEIGVSDLQLNSPNLVIKDRNSNTKLDVASGGTYNYLYNRNTDGTNLMPAGDADARAIYVNLGTNNDVSLNAGSNKVGDVGLLGNTSADGSGTDYHALIDTSGHLQVDVVSASATDLDIRDLSSVQDSVAAVQSGTWNIGTLTTITNAVTVAQNTHDSLNLNANLQQGDADVSSSNELYVRGSGTAGSADAAVLTVQGIASMTPILATLQASDGTDVGNVDVASIAAGTNIIGKTYLTDGTEDAAVNASNQLEVSVNSASGLEVVQDTAADLNVTEANSGTIAGDTTSIDGKITACNTGAVVLSSGTVTTVTTLTGGGVAHDAADSGNPHKIGGRAQEPTATLEEVTADNDRVDAAFDRQGRLAVWMGYPVDSADINDATSGDNTIVAAQGAGLRIAVLGWSIVSDGTVDYRWEDGAGGTAKTGQYPLQAREGKTVSNGLQPRFVLTANTLLNLELSAAINCHGEVSYVVMTD